MARGQAGRPSRVLRFLRRYSPTAPAQPVLRLLMSRGHAMSGDRWQVMAPLSPEEFGALKADIAARGVVVPVVIDAETGDLVDGHHRRQAVAELQSAGATVPPLPCVITDYRQHKEATMTRRRSVYTSGEADWEEIRRLLEELADVPIDDDEPPSLCIHDLRALARGERPWRVGHDATD